MPAERSRASIVAAGILSSRILGLIRWSLIGRYFGSGAHADVLRAAFQAPNLLQNLLGEGTISAAFIPVYTRMLAEGRPEDAGRFAGSILGLLIAVVSACVILGMVLAHPICWILMRGFVGDAAEVADGVRTVDRLELAVFMVRLAFPMAGLLVIGAWALGVLNSHRRFLLPYFAPTLWNVAIIAALLGTGSVLGVLPFGTEPVSLDMDAMTRLLVAVFAGGIVGGALQFGVQLPTVFSVMKGFRFHWSRRTKGVQTALRAVGPAIAGRGVAQISAYADVLLATLLIDGAVATLGYAQVLYILPVSLFALSVAAAELPELTRLGRNDASAMTERLRAGVRQGMFLALPTAIGYVALGYVLIAAIYRGMQFDADDNWLTYAILATYSLGILPTVCSRLVQNGFWALGNTRTPARMALLRAGIAIPIAVPAMLVLDTVSVEALTGIAGSPLFFGAVGLSLGSALAAWIEFLVLRRRLEEVLDLPIIPWRAIAHMGLLAAVALAPAAGVWYLAQSLPWIPLGVLVVATYAGCFLGLAHVTHRPELTVWAGRLR